MKTTIKRCDCDHKFQDKRHGKGFRVHNYINGMKSSNWRCTVCGKER